VSANHGFTVSGLANIHETAEMQAKAQLNANGELRNEDRGASSSGIRLNKKHIFM
jgi:hypothetical protein